GARTAPPPPPHPGTPCPRPPASPSPPPHPAGSRTPGGTSRRRTTRPLDASAVGTRLPDDPGDRGLGVRARPDRRQPAGALLRVLPQPGRPLLGPLLPGTGGSGGLLQRPGG